MQNLVYKWKYTQFVLGVFVCLLFLFSFKNRQAQAQPRQNSESENLSRIYVFFDQDHSYVKKNDTLVSTNFITIEPIFAKETNRNIFGSEHYCKNLFYFSGNKIIFYNPSQAMSSAVWCQVQLTSKKTNKIANYKFLLNKTFSYWCQEKDTNLAIGKTVNAILNIFESSVCSENISPILTDTRVLNLSNSHLEDISPISGFLKVRSLWLDNNEIENLDALGSMQNLVFLSLNNNILSNVKTLGDIPGLQWIFLNNNQIINIDFVHKLKSLKFLGINGNLIGDPTPLYDVSSSTYVLADSNPFIKNLCKFPRKEKTSGEKNLFFLKNCLQKPLVLPGNTVKIDPVQIKTQEPNNHSSQYQKSPLESHT